MNFSFIGNISLNETLSHEATYTLTQSIIIGVVAGILSIVTVIGNIMVMISFKIDKQLQTISNYFLFSLAVADFAIGLISMPLFTIYTLLGYWPLGPFVCDTWLALDYLASNASVLNLLIISFDRYFSVTRPLTYRAKRTTSKAAVMIGCAWGISLLLWPPWIYSWPYIEGERSVPENECYIQFIETNHYITFGTAIAAFYVPVTVMCFLYWRIWRETEKRQKDFPNLQAGMMENNKRNDSSVFVCNEDANVDPGRNATEWREQRADESLEPLSDATSIQNLKPDQHRTRNVRRPMKRRGLSSCFWKIYACCLAWWLSGRDESDTEETPSEQGQGISTPLSADTPLQSSVSRCTSLNVIKDACVNELLSQYGDVNNTQSISTPTKFASRETRNLDAMNQMMGRCYSTESVYTILIRLPGDTSEGKGPCDMASIKMIPDDATREATLYKNEISQHPSNISEMRIPIETKIPKQLIGKPIAANVAKNQLKKKKKTQEKKADKKAAKTLSAILLTFIITWTPYNVLVLLKPVTASSTRILPPILWDFFYYLCYINSTINPMCYALCNASFRRTYLRILQCKWHNRNKTGINRGFYN